MPITKQTKSNFQTACATVTSYCNKIYGPGAIKSEQIQSITRTAQDLIKIEQKERKISAKQNDSMDHTQLIQAVEKILISGKSPWLPSPLLRPKNAIQKLFLQLMRGHPPSPKELLKDSALIKAVIWKKNPELLNEARQLVQAIFDDMASKLEKETLSPHESFHMEVIIGDILSLYPFLNPTNEEKLNVPQLIDGKWQLCSYQAERITLTPKWMGSPLVAFGMKPLHPKAPPILIFKGTTYPTDEGFSLSLLTDLNPAASVGAYAFRTGRKKIQAWLEKETKRQQAVVYGKSLGGAQAWRTALHHPELVRKVMAYGAPGMSRSDSSHLKKLLESSKRLPEINLLCQEGDPVPYVNKHVAQGVHYFKVLGEHPRKGTLAHAEMYSTHEHSILMKVVPSHVAKRARRFGISALRGTLSLFAFPLLALLHAIQTSARKLGSATKRIILPKRDR